MRVAGNGAPPSPLAAERLAGEIEVVRRAPDSEAAWEQLEKVAGELGNADALAAVYEDLLRAELPAGAAARIAARAVRFHEEWSSDDPDALVRVLDRLLEIEPGSSWAFDRLVLALTVAGRWDELFARYDQAIGRAAGAQRRKLLEEATQTAREVAGRPERAIPYLVELQQLVPGDASLAESAERALEKSQQWAALARFWLTRVEQLPPVEGHRVREKVARLQVERLGEPAEALVQIRRLLGESEDDREACRLLEVILGDERAPATVRRGALELLRGRYERAERPAEVVRVLRAALAFADRTETLALHREIAQRLDASGAAADAITHYAILLGLDPHAGDAREELRRLAASGAQARLADALVAAADACPDGLAVDLLVEAAQTRAGVLGDSAGAIDLHRRVLAHPATDAATLLQSARRLNELHEATGHQPERLAILERLAEIEPIAADRRGALGQAARLAATVGDGARAIALWTRRLEVDAGDGEALAGLIEVLDAGRRWSELADALRRRVAQGGAPAQLRADLIRIATLQARELDRADEAIATWKELRDRQGDSTEITDALAALYEERGRWAELAELLEGAAARDGARVIETGLRLGDLYRERLGDADRAVAAYERTLRASPGHAAARAGLIALVEARLERAPDAAARAGVLEEQARMEEESGALEAARRSLARALVLAPARARLDDELLRLAAATDGWDDAAGAFEGAAVSATDERRAAELRFRAGTLCETRLGDPLRAAQAYRAAVIGAGHAQAAAALARAARALGPTPAAIDSLQAAATAMERHAGDDATGLLLEALLELQRPAGGAALAATLARIHARRPGQLEPLREIAELALAAGDDGAAAAVEQLLDEAARQLGPGRRSPRAGEHALWAVETLARLMTSAGQHGAAAEALAAGARLPVDAASAQALRRRAAASAIEGGDRRRAAELYRDAIERDPSDLEAVRALIPLVGADDRLLELLALRRRELALVSDPAQRLTLRLEIARLGGLLEERADRVPMLLANLDEAAGDAASIDALAELFGARCEHGRLVEVLAEQATRLERASDAARAARLWERAARVAEERLERDDAALDSYRRAAAQDATPETLDALARLHARRGDHAGAAGWIERRLASAAGDGARSELVLRLARARADAGQRGRAIAVLEADGASARPLMDLLLELYRAEQAWEPLGRRLVELCERIDDPAALVAHAREAAEVFGARLGAPDRAVTALQRAAAAAPDDRELAASLAEALGAAGRYDEARALFEALVAEKGRRRSLERADLHRRFASVARAAGDLGLALDQLELAAKLDLGRPSLLASLAAVARDAGRLDQSERAYRALLLLVRRQGAALPDVPLAAEILYELGKIAAARGDEGQARELTEAALESAIQHAPEARGLARHLLERRDPALALRLADACLAAAEQPGERAASHAGRARALAALGKPDEALAAWLSAISEAPDALEHQRAAEELAAGEGRLDAYVEGVSALIRRRRRREDWTAHADLVVQQARILEGQGDLRRAAALHRQLAEHGERVVESWAAVVRLAGAVGDDALAREALEGLASLAAPATADLKADALYRVAELQLARIDARSAGFDTLARALEVEPRLAAAAALLGAADAARALDDERFAWYADLAGRSGDAPTLLAFFERRARRPAATLAQDQEAVALASRLNEGARAEALLADAVERARGDAGGLAGASWALLALVERSVAARDAGRAIGWLREAAHLVDPARVRALGLDLAGAIAERDPSGAAETYRLLLEVDAGDREAWEPLLLLHRRLRDGAATRELAERLVATLMLPGERNRVRMSLVAHLVETGELDEAITRLHDVIFDEPGHVDATTQLAELLDRAGRRDELVELLTRQLEDARERGARDLIVTFSLRLGERAAAPEEAAATYRSALEVVPDDGSLLRALAGSIDAARDGARPRAEVLERLLAVVEPAEAPALALELADLRGSLGERAQVERALVAGRQAAPRHGELRDRLERHYRDHDEHAKLAAHLVATAAEHDDAARAVAMLREAAEIHRDFLLEVGRAAECLAQARRLAPGDVALLGEHISTLLVAGDTAGARDEVSRALELPSLSGEARAVLLRQRADLRRGAGDLDAAIEDLETLQTLVGRDAIPELAAALEQKLRVPAPPGSEDDERRTFSRLVAVLGQAGDVDKLREVLSSWSAARPDDLDILGKLLVLERTAERWSEVIRVATDLHRRERGEARAELALVVADAAMRGDDPRAAVPILLETRRELPDEWRLREALDRVYVASGENAELVALLTDEAARLAEPGGRAALFVRVGQLHLEALDDPASAVEALSKAAAIMPTDVDLMLLLAEAQTRAGQHVSAGKLLEAPLAEQRKRRTPLLPRLLLQMARVAEAAGDSKAQLAWVQEAFDADRKNGRTAAELAALAQRLGKYDVALKILRHLSLMDDPTPLTRAQAFYEQAKIALILGNPGQAELWVKKALREDPQLAVAPEILAQIKIVR